MSARKDRPNSANVAAKQDDTIKVFIRFKGNETLNASQESGWEVKKRSIVVPSKDNK